MTQRSYVVGYKSLWRLQENQKAVYFRVFFSCNQRRPECYGGPAPKHELLTSYVAPLWPITNLFALKKALRSLRRFVLDINMLMSIAVIGALGLQDFHEAATVTVICTFFLRRVFRRKNSPIIQYSICPSVSLVCLSRFWKPHLFLGRCFRSNNSPGIRALSVRLFLSCQVFFSRPLLAFKRHGRFILFVEPTKIEVRD